MNKLYRSLLLTSGLAAALAGCGDDLTIVDPPAPPPPPPPAVRQVSVAPDGVTVSPGQTLQMSAAVTADAGCNAATTWSSSDITRATVSASGLVSVLPAAPSGSIAIRATATCATGGATGNGVATLNVVGTTVTAVTITPPSAQINAGTSLSAPGTLQASATVAGTNSPAQTVVWSSLDGTLASVSATGLITANAQSLGGPVVIKACSTANPAVCGTMSLTVVIPAPASVQIQAVTFNNGTNNVPVNLTNVKAQIEIALNVEAGSRNITRVDALVGGQVVATQTFASASAAAAPEAAATLIILSTNTAQVRQNGSVFVPVIFNGNSAITANLYVSGSSTPLASNAIPVVMNNPDAIIRRPSGTRPASLAPTATTPVVTSLNDGETYYKGTQTVEGYDYIAFGRAVPQSVALDSDVCGGSDNLISGGAATTGIVVGGLYDCGGVEGGNDVVEVSSTAYAVGAVGPDGTPLTRPESVSCGSLSVAGAAIASSSGISTVGTAFLVGGENRWNMICPPVGSAPGESFVDNKGPAVTIGTVAFNDSFDQPWVNAGYAFGQDMTASDGGDLIGSGVAAGFPKARSYAVDCPAPNLPTQTGADFAETSTSNNIDGQRICTYAEDLLGNANWTGASNYFGVDFGAPTVRFLGATPPAATPLPVLPASTLVAVANDPTSIYSIAAPPPAQAFGLEAIDGRSGFHQGVALSTCGTGAGCYPASYTFTRLTATGTANAIIASYGLPTPLNDTYVRSIELPILGATAPVTGLGGVGYYNWSGNVTDRAGNTSSTIARNFAADHLLPPNITGLGFNTGFYTPGAAAPFGFSANDDLEIIDATAAVSMHIPTLAGTALRYPFGSLSPLGTRWDATITNVVNGALASIGYFLFRVDEMCTAAATPYPACPAPLVFPYINSSKIPFTTSQVITDGLYNVGAPGAVNGGKLPTVVSANVNDVASQTAAAPIAAPMLSSQFNPSTGISEQWSAADLISWSGSTTEVAASVVGTHVASTSIVNPYFEGASLWRLNGTEWTYCAAFPAPVRTDNGQHRFWKYTVLIPTTGACLVGTTWRIMGTKAGAGLFGGVI